MLTGGSARLDGLANLAESTLQAPVRIGTPQDNNIEGIVDVVRGPMYATGVGLLQLAREQMLERDKKQEFAKQHNNPFVHSWRRLEQWLSSRW